ncbi:MAG: AdoMet dependent proline di-methyltransferase-domain-containing protein [Olpidium bornovanus]|uniref:Alpha N-terminal protein methyltransferase 1 n=1 Tax=Olpidium bornovanus TaxID=278681 RepID=A0A8H7ZN64_9FUNG|nr:MAG: AdoMet dependent proline di-methyltransferase-domain-containing protein [Olpidium bornovanus]
MTSGGRQSTATAATPATSTGVEENGLTAAAGPACAAARDRDRWYSKAAEHWQISHADVVGSGRFINEFVNGVKAGRGAVSKQPIVGNSIACATGVPRTAKLKEKCLPDSPPRARASKRKDCGAGIGRVSKRFLLNYFKMVDLVEQSPKFLSESRSYLASEYAAGRVGRALCVGLQNFTPEEGRYDLIWCQWENISAEVVADTEDNSVTRPDELYKDLFARAGLTVVKEEVQLGFPEELFTVKS